MKGYWLILGTEISDAEAQAQYGKLWAPIAERYGARLNPTTVPAALLESRNTARVILVEFPSYEAAKACYEDPDYEVAKAFALKASQRDLVMLAGDLA